MKAMTLGASSEDWLRVPTNVKDSMVKKIEGRVEEVDVVRAEEKKKQDAIKRSERNKAKTVSGDCPDPAIDTDPLPPRLIDKPHATILPPWMTIEEHDQHRLYENPELIVPSLSFAYSTALRRHLPLNPSPKDVRSTFHITRLLSYLAPFRLGNSLFI